MQHVREILQRKNSAVFTPEVDERIRAQFKGMVSGNLEIPIDLLNQEVVGSKSRV
jgi:hypothetical protein